MGEARRRKLEAAKNGKPWPPTEKPAPKTEQATPPSTPVLGRLVALATAANMARIRLPRGKK